MQEFLRFLTTSDVVTTLLLSTGIVALAVDCNVLHRKVKALQQQIDSANHIADTTESHGFIKETAVPSTGAAPQTA
ncbi:hypothetical protein PG2010B_1363 [Bifidobacterium animalis subsp. lactis]|nr:hypothetical protein PG2007B_1420 [Bifidobacterium animalis subsp. lactis]RYM91637.1 hypothetical protein PG2010B_1363 [Bifidobacterium animalis subsp. lactis]